MTNDEYVFTASRWTRGNLLFPVRIEITPEHVTRVKPHLKASDEESMAISKVASVRIRTGIVWSEIRIDSSGGTDPIVSPGDWERDVQRLRDVEEGLQQRRPERT